MLVARRDMGWRLRKALGRVLLAVLLLPLLSACTVVAGGGVAAAVVAIGVLTSHCYDYLDVTVFDGQGRKTCTATVTASKGSEHFELQSCYYAPLTDGRWTLRASQAGSTDALTTVEVEHKEDCTRHVQSVELSLSAPGAPPRSASSAISGAVAPRAPPPASVPPASNPAPPVSSALPQTPSSAPISSATPSVGVFPNQSETTH